MIFKNPKGPERQRKIDTQSPTTTGGSPILVLTMLRTNFLPGKLPRPIRVPSGKPINKLISVAIPDTFRERKVIAKISGSPVKIK